MLLYMYFFLFFVVFLLFCFLLFFFSGAQYFKEMDVVKMSLCVPHFIFQKDFCLRKAHGKNGFVTATKLGTIDKIFVAATKNIAAATKRFIDRTKHFAVVTKCFRYPYFNKRFC